MKSITGSAAATKAGNARRTKIAVAMAKNPNQVLRARFFGSRRTRSTISASIGGTHQYCSSPRHHCVNNGSARPSRAAEGPAIRPTRSTPQTKKHPMLKYTQHEAMNEFVQIPVQKPAQEIPPAASAVFSGELAFERRGAADAPSADEKRFFGGQAFALQRGHRSRRCDSSSSRFSARNCGDCSTAPARDAAPRSDRTRLQFP